MAQATVTSTAINRDWVLCQLRNIAENGTSESARVRSLELLGKELGMFAAQEFDLDMSHWTPEMLDRMAEHLIRKERGNISAEEMKQVRAELEAAAAAGETVDVTYERTDGEDGVGDARAPDTDWFDEVGR
jgi:hypothetical protein